MVANDGMVLVVARQDGFDTPFRRLIGRTGGFYHYGPWLKGCLTNAKLVSPFRSSSRRLPTPILFSSLTVFSHCPLFLQLLATQRVPDLVVSLTPPLNTTALRVSP